MEEGKLLSLKLAPKEVKDKSLFKNFRTWPTSLTVLNGKIVYMNYENSGKHIYNAYYVYDNTAHKLSYTKDMSTTRDYPLMILDDLSVEDILIFWTTEEVTKHIEAKKKTK